MKKIITLLSLILLMGCSKEFLTKNNISQAITDANYWNNSNDALQAVNGVYQALRGLQLYAGSLNDGNGDAIPLFDNFGDNCYNGYKYEGPGNFMEGTANASTAMFKNLWAQSYAGIYRANNCILNISKMDTTKITDSLKQQYIGQCYFLRGLLYMNLAIYYQDVPLVTSVQTLTQAYIPKSPFADIAKQIISDLNAAANVLPISYPAAQYGYATKGAALGLLCRFYLYTKDYQNAYNATTPLLSMGYSLFSNYSTLFSIYNETAPEVIFSVRFVNNTIESAAGGEFFAATYTNTPKINQQPLPNLVKDYCFVDGTPFSTSSPLYNASNPKTNRDPRLAASIYFNGDVFAAGQPGFNASTTTGAGSTGYGQKKYLRTSTVGIVTQFGSGNQDFYVLRYADVLLMRAEALIELPSLFTPSGVTSLVNQVRTRAGVSSVESEYLKRGISITNIDSLRATVRHERRVELAFEGLRYYDLKRWGTVKQACQAALSDSAKGYNPIYQPGKSEIFPLPQGDLDANPKLVQNQAWQ